MITTDTIKKIAALSMLNLDEAQLAGFTKDMASIVAFADTINSADVSYDCTRSNDIINALREDEIVASPPVEELLRGANGGQDGFFVVPQSIKGR